MQQGQCLSFLLWLLLAGMRPLPFLALASKVLRLRLLSYFKRVVNLNAKVANSALRLGMPKQKLDGSQVLWCVGKRSVAFVRRMACVTYPA